MKEYERFTNVFPGPEILGQACYSLCRTPWQLARREMHEVPGFGKERSIVNSLT